MRKPMGIGKHFFIKITEFVLICGMIVGSVCAPILAEEETTSLHNASDALDWQQESNELDNDKDVDESKKDEKGVDFGKDTDGSKKDEEGTDLGDVTEASKKDEDGTDTDNDIKKEESMDTGKETVSGNDTEDVEKEEERVEEKETVSGNDIGKIDEEEQEIIDVVVPSAYTLALNPYRLPIRIGEDEITTEQIISGNYGIVNKSSTDQIVTVSLTVEDYSGVELLFVDSVEEAENAGMNVYAIYLAAVPANEDQILIGDEPVNENVTAESLQNVGMTGIAEQAITLHAGTNQISFKLFRAVYGPQEEDAEEDTGYGEDDTTDFEEKPENVFQELAPVGMGVTAYTFYGVINPNAAWEKLSGGIKLSVVYTYQTADGNEKIVEGTGAMVATDEIFAGKE